MAAARTSDFEPRPALGRGTTCPCSESSSESDWHSGWTTGSPALWQARVPGPDGPESARPRLTGRPPLTRTVGPASRDSDRRTCSDS